MSRSLTWRAFYGLSAVALYAFAGSSAHAQQPMAQVQIVADGMCCNGCAQKVGAQLYTTSGVMNVLADVPNHLVTVTYRPSPSKLTLGALWAATEKADGKPSKLVTPHMTYSLRRPEQLQLSEPLQPGQYWIVVENLKSEQDTAKAIKQLSAIRGVTSVAFDAGKRTYFVKTGPNDNLSPWIALAAIEQSGNSMVSVTGPYGVFSVERNKQQAAPATAAQQSQQQGTIR